MANKIKSLILRLVSNASYTTKGATLTGTEIDNNFILLADQITSLSNSTLIAAYNSATAYAVDAIVRYDSTLWKALAASTGVTPGTDASKWTEVTAGAVIHEPNKDTHLGKGTASEVAAATLKDLTTYVTTAKDAVYTQAGAAYSEASGAGCYLWFDEGSPAASMVMGILEDSTLLGETAKGLYIQRATVDGVLTPIIKAIGLPTFADDAAAATAGLPTNAIYKTATGELRIKIG